MTKKELIQAYESGELRDEGFVYSFSVYAGLHIVTFDQTDGETYAFGFYDLEGVKATYFRCRIYHTSKRAWFQWNGQRFNLSEFTRIQ